MRTQLTKFKGWKVETVEPGDHGWKITLVGPNERTAYLHTGHTVIEENVIKAIEGKRLGTVIMDTKNTQVYFGDKPLVFDALDYKLELEEEGEEPYSPQWPEEREAIGEYPPTLGEE